MTLFTCDTIRQMHTGVFPTISESEFFKRLKERPYEDVSLVRMIEKQLIHRRGFVFQFPKPKTPVILLFSGGLDSSIAWFILVHFFHLDVYPLSVVSKKNIYEKKALIRIASWMKHRYAHVYHEPFFIHMEQGPKFLDLLTSSLGSPEYMLEYYDTNSKTFTVLPMSGGNAQYPLIAREYAQYLIFSKGVIIDTIFSGVVPSDGTFVKTQTFTFLRSTALSLSLCHNTHEIQYSSLFMESKTGVFVDKEVMIRIAARRRFPLHHTYSCMKNGKVHCGRCIPCGHRQSAFLQADTQDTTPYIHKMLWYRVFQKLKYTLQKAFDIHR